MVTFPFCTILSKRNIFHVIYHFVPICTWKRSINMLGVSYRRVKIHSYMFFAHQLESMLYTAMVSLRF